MYLRWLLWICTYCMKTITEQEDVRQDNATSWCFWLLRYYSLSKLSSVFCNDQEYPCQHAACFNGWRIYRNTRTLPLMFRRLKYVWCRHMLARDISNKFWLCCNILLRYSSFLASSNFSYILMVEGVSFQFRCCGWGKCLRGTSITMTGVRLCGQYSNNLPV